MEFTTAYILGIQRQNEYFGERTAQYKSIDTISVEGYIDVRESNSDYKGVRQALSVIDSYVAAASSSSAVCENIIINGTGFGTGKLVSLDFPASSSMEEDQIRIGKYTASIEIYNSGNLGDSLEGASVPSLQYLENFSEDFSMDLGSDNTYTLSHSLDITYISGVKPDGSIVNPISEAKTLASTLFDQTPAQFSTIIPDSYGSISVASRKYYTENYNLIDGSCTFEQKLKLLPSGMSTYSLSLSNSFSFDQGGIVKVSEEGNIEPRSPEFLNEAKAALDTELDNSYSRCSVIYDSYKNYLGPNSSTLYSQAVTKSKNLDNSAGKSSYSVEYTDDLKVRNLTSLEARTIVLDESNDVVTVTENGTITSINSKSYDFNPYPFVPSRSAVKARCVNFYNNYAKPGNQYTLKNLNNKFTIPKYGKQISYNYAFTSDGNIFDRTSDPVFARKSITHSDKIGVPNQSSMIIPNISSAVLHTPGQTSVGSRSSKLEGQLRRAQYTNNLDSPVTPITAINIAKVEALQDAYMVYANNNLIRSLDRGQIYVTNASYSYGSDNTFSMGVDCAFTMTRLDGNAELNLTFSP